MCVCGGDSWRKGVWNNLTLVADCSGGGIGLKGYLLWNLLEQELSKQGSSLIVKV